MESPFRNRSVEENLDLFTPRPPFESGRVTTAATPKRPLRARRLGTALIPGVSGHEGPVSYFIQGRLPSGLKAEHDAVFLGLGAQSGRPLPVEGSDAPNVVTATAFLKAFNDGRMQHVGKRVVVVGGGDTSIDVATVARRLGHIDQIHEGDRPENAIAGFADRRAHV